MMTFNDETIKLQLQSETQLCLADGMSVPVTAKRSYKDVFDLLQDRPAYHIRMVGLQQNVPLIVHLYETAKQLGKELCLELVTPRICRTEADNSEISIYRMRQCHWPSSLGGWHRVTDAEYVTYALADEFRKSRRVYTDRAEELFRQHPAYRALQFIPTLHESSAACLVADILDPRWFIDLRHPHRVSPLLAYLGIHPKYAPLSAATTVKGKRFRLVRRAWQSGDLYKEAENRPGDFLWRRRNSAKSLMNGELRGAKDFVAYLSRNWHTALLKNNPQQVELFVPEQIFKPHELEAYTTHMKAS